MGLRNRAIGGAGGIYCAFSRSAGYSAARPAECAMHHVGNHSAQSGGSFRYGPVFPQERQLCYFNEAGPPPAPSALYLSLLEHPAFPRHRFLCGMASEKLIGGL